MRRRGIRRDKEGKREGWVKRVVWKGVRVCVPVLLCVCKCMHVYVCMYVSVYVYVCVDLLYCCLVESNPSLYSQSSAALIIVFNLSLSAAVV